MVERAEQLHKEQEQDMRNFVLKWSSAELTEEDIDYMVCALTDNFWAVFNDVTEGGWPKHVANTEKMGLITH